LKGVAFLYAGIETLTDRLPNLFDKDPVDWAKLDEEFTQQLKSLINLKKLPIMSDYTKYRVIDDGLDILHIEYQKDDEKLIFLCNVGQVSDDVKIDFPSGKFISLFDGKTVRVEEGFVRLTKNPIILHK
jgi:cyclomaltodextrinase / maltogenic alpha-amylase / neopullulanase